MKGIRLAVVAAVAVVVTSSASVGFATGEITLDLASDRGEPQRAGPPLAYSSEQSVALTLLMENAADCPRISARLVLLRATLAETPGGVLVTGLLYDLATTRLLHAAEAAGPRSRITSLLCDEIAGEIAEFLGRDAGTRPALAPDAAPERTRLLILGMGHYYSGHYAQAFPAFMKLLREDPGNAEARFWLAQSFHKAGLDKFAIAEIKKFLRDFPQNEKGERAQKLLRQLEGSVPK